MTLLRGTTSNLEPKSYNEHKNNFYNHISCTKITKKKLWHTNAHI